MLVDQATAQRAFDALPARLQMPTLSPGYVAADAHRDPAIMPRFLVHQAGGATLMHAVHEMPVAGRADTDWQSAYGYGGPLVHGFDAAGAAAAWGVLDAAARARRVVAEFVRFHPVVGNEARYPGTVKFDRPVVAIDLSVGDLMASYTGRARTAIRKSIQMGLRAEWETPEDALRFFPEHYRGAMRDIGASAFYLFPDAYFSALLGLPSARVLSVFQGAARVAMAVILGGPDALEYHLSGTTAEGRRIGATNLLLHAAASDGQQTGRSVFYLGGGTTGSADDPLLRFKTSFAPATLRFHIGSRVHDPATYDALRDQFPEQARGGRVLFYRH